MMSGDFWIFSVFLIAIPLAHKQSFLLVHFFRILVRFKWYWLFGLISLRNCHCCVSLILWIPSNDSYLHQGKPALAGLRGSSWSSTDSKGSSGEVISPRQVVAVCRDRDDRALVWGRLRQRCIEEFSLNCHAFQRWHFTSE